MSVGLGNLKQFIYLSMFDRSIGLGISFLLSFTPYFPVLHFFQLVNSGQECWLVQPSGPCSPGQGLYSRQEGEKLEGKKINISH